MPFVTCGASRIFYEEHGEGPPLVLLHGIGGNHASWFQQVPVLSRHFRTITIDHRGFGNSTDEEGLGRGAMVEDLIAVLDELGIARTRVIAQSMSGGVAVNLTCRQPQRVEQLILADTIVGFTLPPELAALQAAADEAGKGLTTVQRVFGDTFLAEDAARIFLYRQISSFNRYSARHITGQFGQQPPEALAATQVPTLFIAGAEERRFPVAVIEGVQSRVAGSLFQLVPGAGHSVYFERPGVFNEVVLRFLRD